MNFLDFLILYNYNISDKFGVGLSFVVIQLFIIKIKI